MISEEYGHIASHDHMYSKMYEILETHIHGDVTSMIHRIVLRRPELGVKFGIKYSFGPNLKVFCTFDNCIGDFWNVSNALAKALKKAGANVIDHEGLNIWSRVHNGYHLFDGHLISAFNSLPRI